MEAEGGAEGGADHKPFSVPNDPTSKSSSASSTSAPLLPCTICDIADAVYCCPRCGARTCSLKCCLAHKKNTGCSGKRDRTAFCSLKNFTDLQLTSDYHFLEDVIKKSEGSKRLYKGLGGGGANVPALVGNKRARDDSDGRINLKITGENGQVAPAHPLLRAQVGKSAVDVLANGTDDAARGNGDETQVNAMLAVVKPGNQSCGKDQTNAPQAQRGPKVEHLVRQAELRGVNLLRMPSGMERHKSNTTKINKKTKAIGWKVEFYFRQISNTAENEESMSDERSKQPKVLKVETLLPETQTLSQEIGRHLDVHPGNASTRSQLRSFANVPRDSLHLFLKRLPCSSASPLYFKLDPNATLQESLKGKTVIEFPTIEVVMDADKKRFPLFINEVP